MIQKVVNIDLTSFQDMKEVHIFLQDKFGFPDFYGKNVNALIDCWTSLRFPEDEMCNLTINSEEILILRIKGFSSASQSITEQLITAIETVNQRYFAENLPNPILLELI
jgi:RNAse (barnase) inhibitor barstar